MNRLDEIRARDAKWSAAKVVNLAPGKSPVMECVEDRRWLLEQVERLRTMGEHGPSCTWWPGFEQPCDCGWGDALAALEADE